MANLTPKQAAQAVLASYDMQNKIGNVSKAFFDLSDQFDFSPAPRFKGISGGAFLMKETGFGVIARGRGGMQKRGIHVSKVFIKLSNSFYFLP